jgi:hypothetical protein
MSYPVEIYVGRDKVATGRVGEDGMIAELEPFQGKGLAYGRHVQITVMAGKHVGQTITAQIIGETGGAVILKEPMPFQ